jgi:probable DNA metabolism protein
MQTLIYDGSFAGLLTAVFEIYEFRFIDPLLTPASRPAQVLFSETRTVVTDEVKASRVWRGLQNRISATGTKQLYKAFLSEEKEMEASVLQYIRYALDSRQRIEYHFTHPAVRYVVDTAKKVHREKHRMEAFVRFQRAKDGLYFSLICPDFNVLPLIQKHFETRYADQHWVIYDTRRKYGLFYDGESTATVEIAFRDGSESSGGSGGPEDLSAILDEKEELYQQLWQLYFNNVNIKARRNMKLHLRHMPLRYWKFLPEKQPQRPSIDT